MNRIFNRIILIFLSIKVICYVNIQGANGCSLDGGKGRQLKTVNA